MTLLPILIAIVVLHYILETWLEGLNRTTWKSELPAEAAPFYDASRYGRAKEYHRANDTLSLWSRFAGVLALLLFLQLDGFARLDSFLRGFTGNPLSLTLSFMGILFLGSDLLSLPFQWYRTFRIEERFGFNRTDLRTFATDRLKGYLLAAVLGGGLLSLVVLFFQWLGSMAWLYAWIATALFLLFINLFYTSLIVPLFNRLTPLEESPLRKSIEEYSRSVGFPLENIYVMDGSRRSSRANAFFSGLGRRKKIVLFDTLMEKHSMEELTAILAHEVGHYKKRHVIQGLLFSLVNTGVMLYLLSWFVFDPRLSLALGSATPSFHMGLVAFSLLFTPLSLATGVLGGVLSRHNEFEADAFAARTYGGAPLRRALEGLSVNHLSNPHPHPLYVFFHYSHPPVLRRVERLQA